MRTESEILNDLATAREKYQQNVDKWKRSQIEDSNTLVRSLMDELQALYTEGVIIPDNVQQYIVGGITGQRRANGQYEIGCTIKVNKLGQWVAQGLCSRGETINEAVTNWNNGIYV